MWSRLFKSWPSDRSKHPCHTLSQKRRLRRTGSWIVDVTTLRKARVCFWKTMERSNMQRTMIPRNFNRCDPVAYRKFLIVTGFVWGPVCLNVSCGESATFSQLHQGYALTATCLPNHARGTAESLQSTVVALMQALYLRFKTSFLFIKYHLSSSPGIYTESGKP